jgi:hypothetical protein
MHEIEWPDVPKLEREPYTSGAATRLVTDPAYREATEEAK